MKPPSSMAVNEANRTLLSTGETEGMSDGQHINGLPSTNATSGHDKPQPATVSQVPFPPFGKLANPGPLGLLGFAVTTLVLGLYECGAGFVSATSLLCFINFPLYLSLPPSFSSAVRVLTDNDFPQAARFQPRGHRWSGPSCVWPRHLHGWLCTVRRGYHGIPRREHLRHHSALLLRRVLAQLRYVSDPVSGYQGRI